MTKQKGGALGRGLTAILPDAEIEVGRPASNGISMIQLSKIEPNPFQPRKEFDEEALEELAESIKQQGVITPVTLRQMPDGTYQIIAGERRCRASKKAGLTEIPAYVRVATDIQMMEMALVENIQRADLNAIEVAQAYKALIEECRLTHDQLSERVGKNRSTITNYLRLLSLPEESQQALLAGKISMAHARVLAGVEDRERHLQILQSVIDRQFSVHQTEQLAKETKPQHSTVVPRKKMLPSSHSAAQSRLRDRFQSAVEIKRSQRGKGTLTISFNSDSDFERILGLIEK